MEPRTPPDDSRYRLLVEYAPDGIFVADDAGHYVDVNPAGCAMLGYTREEILGMRVTDIHMEDERADAMRSYRAMSAARATIVERRLQRKDGSTVRAAIHAWVTPDGCRQAIVRDISEQVRASEEMRKREQLLTTVVSSAPIVLGAVDREGIYSLFTGKGLDAIGLQPGAIVGQSVWERHRDRPENTEGVRLALGGTPSVHNVIVGDIIFQTHHEPIFDEAGKVEGVIAVGIDITERVRTEESLRTSREHLSTVVSNIPVVLAAVDRDGIFTLSEGKGLEPLGLKSGEVVGISIFDLYRGNEENLAAARRVLAGESFVTTIQVGDIVFESHYAPLLDGDGQVDGAIAVGIDITARERAIEAQHETDRYLRTILNAGPAVFAVLDSNGTFKLSEGKLLSRFGRQPGQSIGTSVWEQYAEYPALLDALRRALNGEPASAEVSIAGVELETHFAPTHGGNGEITGAVGIGIDITERKRVEAQLLQAQKMEAVGRLAGGVAHDVNNLMTAIIFNTDLALQSIGAQHPAATDLGETRAVAERAGQMAHQLLAFSRREMIEPQEIQLNDLVARTERMLRRLIGADIDLVTQLSPGLSTVRVDPTQFEQLLMNLIVNARDAMPAGGRVLIETAHRSLDPIAARRAGDLSPGEYVCLSVADTGEGISDDVRQHVFEPFYTTKEVGHGAGLGLAACYGIVKQAGGGIVVDSKPGEGATFAIYVPCFGDAGADGAWDDAPLPAQLPRGTETILLVEDEDSVRRPAARLLARLGYAVTEAPDGVEALRIAAGRPGGFDLLVTDVVMPVLSGRALAARLGSSWPEMRVLFMSGYIDQTTARQDGAARNGSFLLKPFAPDVLARMVRDLLDAPVPPARPAGS
jgi:PAS domain S-box-containing protein